MNLYRRIFYTGIVFSFFLIVDAKKCPKETNFLCHSDKKCIDSSLRCDQIFDCNDHSDEENCDSELDNRANCIESQFRCSNGKCIDSKKMCDGLKDCISGEDEHNCTKLLSKKCRTGQFKCSDDKCIPKYWVCDGRFDCSNDESNCIEKNENCSADRFLCADKRKCIPTAQRCNQYSDCADDSDEIECAKHDQQKKCQINQFMCSDGKCIEMDRVCDESVDCSLGEDETDKKCFQPKNKICGLGQYKCSNNRCIPKSWVCDGTPDCTNDEENCGESTSTASVNLSYNITCSTDDFICHDKLRCIRPEQRCDLINHCADASDEKNCEPEEQQTKCNQNQFSCPDGKCIDTNKLCDGTNDCPFGEDENELNCQKPENETCLPDEFMCSNGQCIPNKWLCDGAVDCSNDEENCDCSDGDYGSNGCATKWNSICSTFQCPKNATCQIHQNRPTCVCAKGYSYNEINRKCEDIDECLNFGICSQGCVNTIGSYKCTCISKFRLSSDNHTCHVIGKIGALLLYAAGNSVNWFTLKSNHLKRVAGNLNQAIGISYDGKNVYWTNILAQAESIMKAKNDGNEITTLFSAGLSKPTDIAVDYITRNIYFTDNDVQHLAVCSNDGRFCKPIITDNVHRPRGIVLYSQKGKMYWSNWGSHPMIAVASMDGTFSQPLITQNIHWPNGLTLDWPNDRLYWIDTKFKSIESCKLDGTDRRTIIKNASNHPYGIAVFQDTIFWSDWESKNIQSCHKFTGRNINHVLYDDVIYDIDVFHPAMQSVVRNPCHQSQCSHLCLLNMNYSYTCACPKYMELAVDKHNCRSTGKQKTILMGIGNKLATLEYQSFGRREESRAKTLNLKIDKIAFNSITGDIFVADNLQRAIFSVNIRDNTTKEVITDNIGSISAMTFDDIGNKLYWTDVERSTIEVFSLSTQHRAVVQHFLGEETPVALVAIPEIQRL